MGAMASEITSLTIVYSTVYSEADERKHQSSVSLVFVRGIHRRSVNFPHKGPVLMKMFPFDDVIMYWTYTFCKRSPDPPPLSYILPLRNSHQCILNGHVNFTSYTAVFVLLYFYIRFTTTCARCPWLVSVLHPYVYLYDMLYSGGGGGGGGIFSGPFY